MAIIYFTGFDPGGTAEQYGFMVSGTVSITAEGRRGGRCLRLGGGNAAYPHHNAAGLVTGFAASIPSLPSSDTVLVAWQDGSTTQVDLRITSTGAIRATRNGTSLGISADNVVPTGAYFFLEARVIISSTAGSVLVTVNGSTVLSLTNVNTQATGNAYANRLLLNTVTSPTLVDDLHHFDTTGTSFNDLMGDMPVVAVGVSGPGSFAQWTPNGASANWDAVDDLPPDGDATFNNTMDAGRVDSFAHSPVTGLAAVRAVKVAVFARKDDSASRFLEPGLVIGGAFYSGGSVPLSDNYQWVQRIFTTNPATGGDWTADAVNGAEIAYRSASS